MKSLPLIFPWKHNVLNCWSVRDVSCFFSVSCRTLYRWDTTNSLFLSDYLQCYPTSTLYLSPVVSFSTVFDKKSVGISHLLQQCHTYSCRSSWSETPNNVTKLITSVTYCAVELVLFMWLLSDALNGSHWPGTSQWEILKVEVNCKCWVPFYIALLSSFKHEYDDWQEHCRHTGLKFWTHRPEHLSLSKFQWNISECLICAV